MKTIKNSYKSYRPEGKSIVDRIYRGWVKILRFFCLLSLALVVLSGFLKAEGYYGQASDIFQVGAGARAMAMGSAFTGLADDASAPYYNPAGLAFLDEHQVMAMHAPLMMDTNLNYIASAHPLGDKWGSLALSDVLLLSNKFETRDAGNKLTGSDEELRNNVIFASYAHKLPKNLAAGLNLKIIQQKIAGYSGTTMGLDLGFIYRPSSLFSLGVALENFNSPSMTLDTSADQYRPVKKAGVASEVFKEKVTLTVDAFQVAQENTQYAAGIEYTASKLFQFRAGYNGNRSYTFGLGVKINPFRVDYAFSNTDIGAFNKVSFTWAWHNIYKTEIDPPVKEGRAVYPLSGFENQVAFKTATPNHTVARWSLVIKNAEGQEVRTLEADLRPPEVISWDAKNQVGEPVVAGKYTYIFDVKYKNGKEWVINGDIDMALPNNKLKDVIDMNLDINGARAMEEDLK